MTVFAFVIAVMEIGVLAVCSTRSGGGSKRGHFRSEQDEGGFVPVSAALSSAQGGKRASARCLFPATSPRRTTRDLNAFMSGFLITGLLLIRRREEGGHPLDSFTLRRALAEALSRNLKAHLLREFWGSEPTTGGTSDDAGSMWREKEEAGLTFPRRAREGQRAVKGSARPSLFL